MTTEYSTRADVKSAGDGASTSGSTGWRELHNHDGAFPSIGGPDGGTQ